MANRQVDFDFLLTQVDKLLQDVADQQTMDDSTWVPKWVKLRKQLEECVDEAFNQRGQYDPDY